MIHSYNYVAITKTGFVRQTTFIYISNNIFAL